MSILHFCFHHFVVNCGDVIDGELSSDSEELESDEQEVVEATLAKITNTTSNAIVLSQGT